MKISIVIPTYNEASHIASLINHLKIYGAEKIENVIVSDGGSVDATAALASEAGATVVFSPDRGRAAQLNHGASFANGDILYFVHADTIPPETFADDILKAVQQGSDLGRFLSAYQSSSWCLKINAFLSRLDTFEGMGGDQTLFIRRDLFLESGGFDYRMKIMEEFEFCARVRRDKRYTIIPKPVLISARKYETNSWFKVQKANFKVVKMYKSGASQDKMVEAYRSMLNRY